MLKCKLIPFVVVLLISWSSLDLLPWGSWTLHAEAQTQSSPELTVKTQSALSARPLSRELLFPELKFRPDLQNTPAFTENERLLYEVSWLTINAGFAEIAIADTTTLKNRKVYHFIARAWTNSFFSKFFVVNDRIESFFDSQLFFPYLYKEDIKEGSYTKKRIYDFNHAARTVHHDGKKYSVSASAQDPFSCLMILRIIDFQPNQTFTIDVFANRRCYQITMNVGLPEEITTNAGTFTCLPVEPVLKLRGRVLEHNSRLKLWFSNDLRRIPVRLETKVKIGTIVADLHTYSL